jgi:hypothetical protein
VPILLQKSKIEQPRKSRESRFLDSAAAARFFAANTKAGGRFCMKRCGPSRRRARSASAVFKIFALHPKKTFSTLSARSGSQLIYGEPRWSFAHKAEMPLSRKNAFRDTIARFAVCFLD